MFRLLTEIYVINIPQRMLAAQRFRLQFIITIDLDQTYETYSKSANILFNEYRMLYLKNRIRKLYVLIYPTQPCTYTACVRTF